jgi:hypothetical protein
VTDTYARRPRNGLTWKQRAALGIEAEETLPPRVDRDPCIRCGVRADVGCGHKRIPTRTYEFSLVGGSL